LNGDLTVRLPFIGLSPEILPLETAMFRARACSVRLAAPMVAVLAGALCAAGCGDETGVGTVYPVSGTITLNGEPLTEPSTTVIFKPDAAKGNQSTCEPVGTVDEHGTYMLRTKGKKGAPPGWYKVLVGAYEGRPQHAQTPGKQKPALQSVLPAKYTQVTTTELQIEVVENPAPGAYDLKLVR
jgi:hypothetical protein